MTVLWETESTRQLQSVPSQRTLDPSFSFPYHFVDSVTAQMRVFASVLLTVSSAFAYQVTFPGNAQGWNNTGPNYLSWARVDTDPLTFTAVLTNVNTNSNQVMDNNIDGTLGIVQCSAPSGGWPSGSGFRVNLVQDAQHLDTILAQSNQFNITAVSSGSTTSSASTQAATSGVTVTATATPSAASGVTSSSTSTTPTGVSAASLGADTQAGLLTAVAALTAFITTLF
ncbi:hypothetical protein J3R82DRAFT_4321 [Butyriboletus roseoflavus]|nr:hypothetical protein J3R82DRAFT_4321 [Butyriboletus roseoflavus]